MADVRCPVCASTSCEAIMAPYTGPAISSDFGVVDPTVIDNRICRDCGLVFNARGVREHASSFYRDTYSLLLQAKEAGVSHFFDNRQLSQARLSFELLAEQLGPVRTGRLFEAGAGKGHFLRHFQAAYPEWTLTALEPSQAHRELFGFLPQDHVFACSYNERALPAASQDVIVALGVLEHVPDPLDMLRWMHRGLAPDGRCFIRVPNFCHNPNDLFCVDHLSKLTPATLEWLAIKAEFRYRLLAANGVPVYVELTKDSVPREPVNAYASNKPVAEANAGIAQRSLETIAEVRRKARARWERFAIFGLAASGLFAPFGCGFSADEITAYIDENPSMAGMRIHGRPVGGLELVRELDIRHIALTISPVYWDAVAAKLKPLGVAVYTPTI